MELDIRVTVTSRNGSAGVRMGLTDLIQDTLPPGITVTVERFGEHQLTTCCEFISSFTHLYTAKNDLLL